MLRYFFIALGLFFVLLAAVWLAGRLKHPQGCVCMDCYRPEREEGETESDYYYMEQDLND